jgi:hypothetical protein
MTKNYDYDVQKLYLEMMLADAETFVRCQGIFDASLFDRKLQEAAEFIHKYAEQYTVLPEFEMVNASCGTEFKDPGELKDGHLDWLMDEFETFTRHKSLERAIIESADLLEKHDYGQVESKIKEAVQIGLARDMGTDYFADPRARLMGLKDKNGQVSTGWSTMDRKLFGGMNRGELNIFAGGSGAGKSLFLANLGVNWALNGMNVIYLTLELSEALVSMRIDSMLTGVSTKEIFRNIDDIEMKVKLVGKKAGLFQVKYMPSGKTVNDIRAYIKEYEIKVGRRVDVLLVELRNLAREKQCVFVTAAQLNRGAVEEVEFDHSHISGGLSKIQTADNVFGIFTSRAMRERGRYQLQLMKTRSSSGVGQKIDLEFNIETLRISDLPEDQQELESQTRSNQIINQIKSRSSTVVDQDGVIDPNRGASLAPAPKAIVESTKLKQFINNLTQDEE